MPIQPLCWKLHPFFVVDIAYKELEVAQSIAMIPKRLDIFFGYSLSTKTIWRETTIWKYVVNMELIRSGFITV